MAPRVAVLLLWGCSAETGDRTRPAPADDPTTGAPTAPDVDTDGDGVSDADEQAAGTDPLAPDTDLDWLDDGQERDLGTDPLAPDTDADGYLDGDEVLEDRDPLDASSRIYVGGWPYHRLKDDLPDPGFDGSVAVGGRVPRLVTVDQFGDALDLYDFAYADRPVVVDLSALWCGPCQELAAWLAGQPSSLLDSYDAYDAIPQRVEDGEILWVTVLFESGVGVPAGAADAVAWDEAFAADGVAVMVDDDRSFHGWVFPGSYPSLLLLDPSLTVTSFDRFSFLAVLDALVAD